VHFEASSFWTVGSWDRHQIPKPGSHIVAVFGEPMTVESTAPEVVEARRLDLEHVLARLELQARETAAGAAGQGH
jgi:lysophospholipid acyltransferase (LPLAT)-like uncharacterized protein